MSFDLKKSQNKQPAKYQEEWDAKSAQYDMENEENIEQDIGKILHSWRAPQFEVYEKSGRWYLIGALFILALVVYALFSNSPMMAITFILIGIVGYIYSQKDPLVVNFAITKKGILADKELYLYENIHSFWIFYEQHHSKIISLHTKASAFPFVHIPIGDENPAQLHEILTEYIPEIKQDPSLIDTIGRVLHI